MPFDAIEYINTPRWLTSRLGLERIRELLDRLGRPQDRLKFVHVAGTNGKGSTCAFTASILAEAGFKTGLFTSPYVETFHERIRVNGRNISDEDLTAATLRVRECAEAMEAEGGEHPTEFELMTAVALVHFAHVGCDIVVLEVGLGGRLDSTNVIAAPEVAAIVSIALDHTNLLGNTLAEIAHEKAGIVKKGSAVVSWPQEPSAMEVVEDAARRAGDKLVVPDFSMLSVGKVTRGAALLTCATALEHEGHTPCSDSPRFAAELRAAPPPAPPDESTAFPPTSPHGGTVTPPLHEGISIVFHPTWGTLNVLPCASQRGIATTVPGKSPSPHAGLPSGAPSTPYSNIRCSPRQIPKKGTPACTRSRMASICPSSHIVAAASAKAPTPGKTMASALAISDASAVMRASPPAAMRPRSTDFRLPFW